MVWLQNSISKFLRHYTISCMLSNKILKAQHVQNLSCYSPRVSTWCTIRPTFTTFQLSSPIFSIAIWTWLGLPHPSIANILQCVCMHPIDPMGIHLLHAFIAMSTREPMMQFTTPLPPLHATICFRLQIGS